MEEIVITEEKKRIIFVLTSSFLLAILWVFLSPGQASAAGILLAFSVAGSYFLFSGGAQPNIWLAILAVFGGFTAVIANRGIVRFDSSVGLMFSAMLFFFAPVALLWLRKFFV